MAEQFSNLLSFFGISGTPQNFAELIPWLITVLVAVGLVLAVFKLVGWVSTLNRRI